MVTLGGVEKRYTQLYMHKGGLQISRPNQDANYFFWKVCFLYLMVYQHSWMTVKFIHVEEQ